MELVTERVMETLSPQPWMTTRATSAVIAALSAGGSEVRFVGGCVRDAVLGRPPGGDIDIATPDLPLRVISLLEAAGLKAVPTGIAHGTVTAVAFHKPFEVTTLRRDVETYGRHAKVAFTDDWAADAARRDFTFNALSCSPSGRLYDPFGGIADLKARRVRFVGRASDRIEEDVLRLLRFFRFYAHFGAPPPDGEALAAAEALAPLLPTLSGERIAAETLKLLSAAEPAPVMTLMRDHRVLIHFLPEAERLDRLARLVDVEARLGLAADAPRRLAAALDGAVAAHNVAARLRLSNALRDRLIGALSEPMPWSHFSAAQCRALRYRLAAESYRDRCLIAWAEKANTVAGADDRWREVLAFADWTPPVFPIKGQDALDRGVAAAPELGRLMAELEQEWIASDFAGDRAALLGELDRRLKSLTLKS
jgi:poly(A) polymerase